MSGPLFFNRRRVQLCGIAMAFSIVDALGTNVLAQVPATSISGPPTAALQPISAGPTSTEAGVVNEATAILASLAGGTATQIPQNLLASAEGVAIIPHYVRGAFVIGVAGGRGVLLMRDANRNWQAPEFMTIGGGSIGWQAGFQSTDLVLVFRSPRSLNNIRTGKVTLGVDASAAAGPVGRYASAATDASVQAEIYTYSKTRGLFAGIALDGASLNIDVPATKVYYQTTSGGPGVIPPSAITLVQELTRLSSPVVPAVGTVNNNQLGSPAGTTGQINSISNQALIPIPPGGLRQLESEVISLLGNVSEEWQLYLALPASWEGASAIPASEVYSTLAKYERVATNPEFAALKAMPAFDQAIASLRTLSATAPNPNSLLLPPPPVY